MLRTIGVGARRTRKGGGALRFWGEQVVPRLTQAALGTPRHHAIRERVCAGLTGDVLELGFGSGLNTAHYPSSVRRVGAVEPSDVAWRLSKPRREASATPIERAGLDGQDLPFEDDVFDTALSTWTLCTIADPVRALREVARVLRPGGQLVFVEHGAAPDAGVLAWQRRLDPLQRRAFAGCHLSRPIDELLTRAGLPPHTLSRYYAPGEPRPFAHLYEGSSTKALAGR